jgi:hypothetical protein
MVTMLATLAITYGIDRWVFLQFNLGKPNDVRAISASIGTILGGLLTCLLWVLFCWIILVKNRRSLAASIIFILIGLLAFIWFPLETLSPFWLRYLFIFPTAPINLQSTGLLITALGILTLLLPKHNLDN